MNVNRKQLSGLLVAGLATVLSAKLAAAGCNCGTRSTPAHSVMPPSHSVGQGDWGNSTGYPAAVPYAEHSGTVYEGGSSTGSHWAPGGYEPRTGSPVYYHDPAGGQYETTGDPYHDHFGPGFHQDSLHGHYRFPYYNYRAPWYYPGRAVYNRDTNFPW